MWAALRYYLRRMPTGPVREEAPLHRAHDGGVLAEGTARLLASVRESRRPTAPRKRVSSVAQVGAGVGGENKAGQAGKKENTADAEGDGGSDGDGDVEEVVYFMGIIDVLQRWNARKKAETTLKRVRHLSMASEPGFSCVDPKTYRIRMVNFMRDMVFAKR